MQSKQKSVILCRPGNISPPPYLFISSLWFFLTSFLYNRMINQFINDFIIHALLKKTQKTQQLQKELQSTTVTWTVLLVSNYCLIFFCLFWYYLISWQNFDSENCIGIFYAWSKRTLVFSCAERFYLPFLISLCLHLQSLQKMAGHRKRKAPLTPLQLALLPVRRLK